MRPEQGRVLSFCPQEKANAERRTSQYTSPSTENQAACHPYLKVPASCSASWLAATRATHWVLPSDCSSCCLRRCQRRSLSICRKGAGEAGDNQGRHSKSVQEPPPERRQTVGGPVPNAGAPREDAGREVGTQSEDTQRSDMSHLLLGVPQPVGPAGCPLAACCAGRCRGGLEGALRLPGCSCAGA